MARYQPVPPGYELFDGDNVNTVIDAVNAALVTAGNPVKQLSRHQSGFRLMSGDSFNLLSQALVALGRSTPVVTTLQKGPRLFTGDLLDKMAVSIGA